jgi:hypothetical protein
MMFTDLDTCKEIVGTSSRTVRVASLKSILGEGSTSKFTVVEDWSKLRRRRALPATTSTIVILLTLMPRLKARFERNASLTL